MRYSFDVDRNSFFDWFSYVLWQQPANIGNEDEFDVEDPPACRGASAAQSSDSPYGLRSCAN